MFLLTDIWGTTFMNYTVLNQELLNSKGISGKIIAHGCETIGSGYNGGCSWLDGLYDIVPRGGIITLDILNKLIEAEYMDVESLKKWRWLSKFNLSLELMRKYQDNLNWGLISHNNNLADEVIIKFADMLDLSMVLMVNNHLDLNTINYVLENHEEEYLKKNKSLWLSINMMNQNISDNWIEENYDKLYYSSYRICSAYRETMNDSRQLPDSIIEKVIEKSDKDSYPDSLSDIVMTQAISEDIMFKYKDKIDFRAMFDTGYTIDYHYKLVEKFKSEYLRDVETHKTDMQRIKDSLGVDMSCLAEYKYLERLTM